MQINNSILDSISEYIPVIYKQMKIMEDRAAELTEIFLQMNSVGDLCFNIFLIALVPAIGEELFFRGIIQKKLENILTPHLSVFIASFIFFCNSLPVFWFSTTVHFRFDTRLFIFIFKKFMDPNI